MTSGCMTASNTASRGRCMITFWQVFDFQDRLARFLENHDEPHSFYFRS